MIKEDYKELSENNLKLFMKEKYNKKVEDLIESGYSISEIEASLLHSYTWADWEQNLYDMFPHNPSRENLSHLFEIW